MLKFIIRRLTRGFVTLLIFQSLLFALIHYLPYDFTAFLLLSPSVRGIVRRQFGLHLPVWEQYLNWLGRFLRFDMGVSYQYWPNSVLSILSTRLSRTLLLFLSAAILSYLLGIWLGKIVAWRRGSVLEAVATLGGIASYTSFAPWLGFVMISVFAWTLGWFPYQRLVNHNVWFDAPVTVESVLSRLLITVILLTIFLWITFQLTRKIWRRSTRLGIQGSIIALLSIVTIYLWIRSGIVHLALDLLNHLVLPLGTVILLSFGETMMTMRASMLETQNADFVLMARAKGLPDRVIRDRHVARNAILPVITRLLLNLPFVLVGSLVIERVFQWQAMGGIIFGAIEFQDIPILMGILSIVGMLALSLHILLDILYVLLDPRVRHESGSNL